MDSIANATTLPPFHVERGIMTLLDNDSFIQANIVKDVMKTFGWNLKEHKSFQDFALMRADFYPIGFVLATSKRAIIVCDGETEVIYQKKKYNSVDELFEFCGNDAIANFDDWNFIVVKEWVIRKNSGEFITTFTTLKEMPFEKTCFKRKRYARKE